MSKPYFFAIPEKTKGSANEVIDWAEMERSYYDQHIPIPIDISRSAVDFHDCIVKERFRNTYYYMRSVRHDLSPKSLCPIDDKRLADASQTIGSFYENYNGELSNMIDDQPVLEVNVLKRKLNYLAPPSKATDAGESLTPDCLQTRTVYLLPQYCDRVNMRASVVRTSFLLPSLMVRLDSYLFADELNTLLGTNIRLDYLVDAITTKQANHACDYERLEFLGDAYLKLISTLAVFVHFPYHHEGLLTMRRTAILNNENLRHQAIKLRL